MNHRIVRPFEVPYPRFKRDRQRESGVGPPTNRRGESHDGTSLRKGRLGRPHVDRSQSHGGNQSRADLQLLHGEPAALLYDRHAADWRRRLRDDEGQRRRHPAPARLRRALLRRCRGRRAAAGGGARPRPVHPQHHRVQRHHGCADARGHHARRQRQQPQLQRGWREQPRVPRQERLSLRAAAPDSEREHAGHQLVRRQSCRSERHRLGQLHQRQRQRQHSALLGHLPDGRPALQRPRHPALPRLPQRHVQRRTAERPALHARRLGLARSGLPDQPRLPAAPDPVHREPQHPVQPLDRPADQDLGRPACTAICLLRLLCHPGHRDVPEPSEALHV